AGPHVTLALGRRALVHSAISARRPRSREPHALALGKNTPPGADVLRKMRPFIPSFRGRSVPYASDSRSLQRRETFLPHGASLAAGGCRCLPRSAASPLH